MMRLAGIVGMVVAFGWCGAATASDGLPVDPAPDGYRAVFGRDVYPVLKRNCLACHNATKAKGGLNLETRQDMLEGGDSGPALTPGDAAGSLLFGFAAHRDESPMPPPKNKSNARNLTPRELGLLARWIDGGAQGGESVASAAPESWQQGPSTGPIFHVAISPDGRLAAAAQGSRVFVSLTADGTPVGELVDPTLGTPGPAAHLDHVQSMVFTPDGDLITGGFRTVKHWRRGGVTVLPDAAPAPAGAVAQTSGGEPLTDLATLARLLGSTTVLPGGGVVFAGRDGVLRLCAGPGDAIVSLGRHVGEAITIGQTEIASGADGSGPGAAAVVALSSDGAGSIWAADGAGEIGRWKADPEVRAFAVATARPIAATWAGGMRSVSVWDLGTGKRLREIALGEPETERAVRAERDRIVEESLIGHYRKQEESGNPVVVKRREELETAREEARKSQEAVTALAAEIKGLEMGVAAGEAADPAPADLPAKRKMLEEKSVAATKLATENRGKEADVGVAERRLEEAEAELASATAARTGAEARLADAVARKAAAETAGEGAAPPAALSLSADGRRLGIRRTDGAVQLWDIGSGQMLESFPAGKGRLAISPVRPWGLYQSFGATGDAKTFPDRVTALDVSRDGRWLAVGSGVPSRSGEVSLWDLGSGERKWVQPDAHADSINAIAFSRDGEWLATGGSDRLVKVFRGRDGAFQNRFEGHAAYVMGVGWRADGLRIVSCGTDNSMRVWEVGSAKTLTTKADFRKGVTDVSYRGLSDTVLMVTGEPSLRAGNDVLFQAGDYLHAASADAAGDLVAVGGQDGVLRVFEIGAKKLRFERAPTAAK